MSADFRIIARDMPDVHVVALSGELDIGSADGLASALVKAAGSTVVVDLSGLTFLDSRGVAALVDARDRILAAGKGDLVLTRPGGMVRTVLDITGLDAWITEWSPDWD